MYPLIPRPTLIVDTWGFRLVDPQGNYVGKQDAIEVKDASGNIVSLTPMPGIERTVQALPDSS